MGDAQVAAREANAEQLDKKAQLAAVQADETKRAVAAQEIGRRAAVEATAKADESVKDFKFNDYFKNRTTGQKLLAGIFAGLGVGMEYKTGKNPYEETIHYQIEHDFNLQKADLAKRERFQEMARKGETDLASRYKLDLAGLDLKQGKAMDALAAEAEAQAIRNGATPEEAKNNVLVQSIRRKGLEKRADGQEAIAKAAAQLALARAAMQEKKGSKAEVAAGKAQDESDQTEVLDYDGNVIGHTAGGRSGHALAGESRKRSGAAQALVAQLDEAIKSVEGGPVAGVAGYGTEAYKERIRLLAGVQAKARAFSELPSSEGGLHLEHQQIGGTNSASAEQLRALRNDVVNQTNIKNKALITSRSRGASAPQGGSSKPAGKAHPQDQAAVEWANANPTDPRAKRILELNAGQ